VCIAIFACLLAGKAIKDFMMGFALVAIITSYLSQTELFSEANQAFLARWEEATDQEGGDLGVVGVLDVRVGGVFRDAITIAKESGFLGEGIGIGSNVGAVRLSGQRDFLVCETEWGLIMGELGIFLGSFYIFLRVVIALYLILLGFKNTLKGNTLPLILSAFVGPALLMGSVSQPTSLGFIIFGAGLMYASCNSAAGRLLPSIAGDLVHSVDESSLNIR
jgi:hypothetical protein